MVWVLNYVIIGDETSALAVAERLLAIGLWVPAIRPPTVPRGTARLRITLSAAHTDAMPAAYLLNTDPETISLHVALIQTLESGDAPVTDFRPLPALGQTELTLVAHDEPGLLAKLNLV